MQGITINNIVYDIDIWCDCNCKFNMHGTNVDSKCPNCGAIYGMLPIRVDGE